MSFNWSERVNNLSEVFYKTVQASVKLERASQHSVQMKSLTIDCISFSRLVAFGSTLYTHCMQNFIKLWN